jgi:arabinoxylan arabinofuranohydrolase
VTTVRSTKNPIIPGKGVCDPHVKVFDDVCYLYASHDTAVTNTDYDMRNWHVWSSTDFVTWTHEAVIDPAQFYTGPTNEAWAVDVARRGDSYYLYFSDGNRATGVARSDSPVGPFVDALGGPLLDGSLTTGRDYDPTVFVDDDDEAYIVVGGPEWAYPGQGGYFIARLGDDMVSLAETPRLLEVDHPADDKASLNKFGDHYYLTFASHVAVSDSVYGPYRYLGSTGASLDHGSFFSWRGQDYHAFTIFDPTLWHRATGLCYVHRRSDLMLEVDQLIVEYGVGRYMASWNRIEAEWFTSVNGGEKVECFRGGYSVVFSTPGEISFRGVFGGEDSQRLVLVGSSSGSSPATIRVVIDGHTTITTEVGPTGPIQFPRFFVHPVAIPGVTDSVELQIFPPADGQCELDWWMLSDVPVD